MIDGRDKLPLARGCFDQVEYLEGCLVVKGWMLLPGTKFDSFSVLISSEHVAEIEVLQNEGVEKAFLFLPNAKFSGFALSLQRDANEINRGVGICITGMVDGKPVAKMETWYFPHIFDDMAVPPANLMKRITNTDSLPFFQVSALKSFRDYWEPACLFGNANKMKNMLDWGCGCGRFLHMFKKLTEIPDIHGCDVDQEAIEWCQSNIHGAQFAVIPFFPPTDYPSNLFDLVIGNSVFTHLTKHGQLLWLEEIRRIIRPGGLFLASVHGESATFFCFPKSVKEILKNGIYDKVKDSNLDGIAPSGYYRGTYQSREYTRKTFGEYFRIVDYVERGSLNYQDLVIMRKSK